MADDRSRGRVDALLQRRLGHRPGLLKWVKYSTASLAGVVTGQSTLLFCLLVLDLSPVASNIIAVTLGGIPNYLINRAWTFDKQGTHSFTREVVPFWSMAFLGLLLSTFSVAWAADYHALWFCFEQSRRDCCSSQRICDKRTRINDFFDA